MKQCIFIIVALISFFSCTNNHKWEYKVVRVAGQNAETMEEFSPLVFDDQTPMLNKMGEDGWELVDVYTETNTAMPNYGSSEYVTGLRSNTRTAVLNFVFKRIPNKQQNK